MARKLFRLLGLVLLLTVFVGCVRESTSGDTHVFSYELWASGLIFLGGLLAIPAGWMLRESSRFGWALLILGPIAVLGIAPSMFMDHVDVSPSGFSRHSGIWGMTSVQDVKFADVSSIRATIEEERGRRGRKVEKLYLNFSLKNGSAVKLPVNNNVTEAAAPHIIEAATSTGIDFTGLP